MNILFIKHFFVGFMVSEILIVSVFGYFPLFTLLVYAIPIYWISLEFITIVISILSTLGYVTYTTLI